MLHMPTPMLTRGPSGPVGQALFTSNESLVVPEGVFSICVVAIGRGRPGTSARSGGGGALAYLNDLPVIPGETLDAIIDPVSSRFVRGATSLVAAGAPQTVTTAGQVLVGQGFPGGLPSLVSSTGQDREGAGAGGYTGPGGNARDESGWPGIGGGGTSPYGGAGGGLNGDAPGGISAGGTYGGGGSKYNSNGVTYTGPAGPGCVRVIWGDGRAFPNTNTGDIL